MTMLKRLLWIAIGWMLATAGDVHAAPCVPKTWLTPDGTGTQPVVSIKPAGDTFAWWCPDPATPGNWRGITYACLKAYCPADWLLVALMGEGVDSVLSSIDAGAIAPADASEAYRFDMLHYQACKTLEAAPPPAAGLPPAAGPTAGA